jgi:hypothetical protein
MPQKNEPAQHMSFDYLAELRSANPAWRLMASTQAPYVISFLYSEFIANNRRNIPEQELIGDLEDFLALVNQGREDGPMPGSSRDYLISWADDKHGWLKRFYPQGVDEPHFDITAMAQKAVEWLNGLKPQAFIGTESRLKTVFELLRQIVAGSEADPEQRLLELQRQKNKIDEEIQRVMNGEIAIIDDTQIKERFWQAMNTAREIISDFREVERNFRGLDRSLRERIATWDKGKGELLSVIFNEQDGISESEQGKSFSAFWSFLMSSASQDDFSDMLEYVLNLKPIKELGKTSAERNIQHDWINAGAHVQETVAALSQQLRRYVDETFIEEERRINQVLRSIEGKAIALRNNPPKDFKMEMDDVKPEIVMQMDRPLFVPTKPPEIVSDEVVMGDGDMSLDALYSQVYVDKDELKERIYYLLQTKGSVSVSQVIESYPLKLGLSELIMYMVIASEDIHASFHAKGEEQISWEDENGLTRHAKIPLVTFERVEGGAE